MSSSVRGGEEVLPVLVVFAPMMEKSDFILFWEKNLGKTAATKVLSEAQFWENVISPPHSLMSRWALEQGEHAFSVGMRGDFPVQSASYYRKQEEQAQSRGRKDCVLCLELGNVWDMGGLPVWSGSLLAKSSPKGVWGFVGKGFAWVYSPLLLVNTQGTSKSEAIKGINSPVSIEEIGALLRELSYRDALPRPLGVRSLWKRNVEEVGITHCGQWAPNEISLRMRYHGARVFMPEGVLEDGVRWNGKDISVCSPKEMSFIQKALSLYQVWWKELSCSFSAYYFSPIAVSPEEMTFFSYHQWVPSSLVMELPYMPSDGKCWTQDKWRDCINSLSGMGVGGAFPVDVVREGNYEIMVRLSPPALSLENKGATVLSFQAGEALLKCGDVLGKMSVLEGATELMFSLDLFSGKQLLEINVTGQGRTSAKNNNVDNKKGTSISVPWVRIRYKGERVTPLIKL